MNLTEYYCNLVKQNLNHIISIIMPGTHPEYRKGIDIYIDLYNQKSSNKKSLHITCKL